MKLIKNPHLCEQPFCREPWTVELRFWNQQWGHATIGHYCAAHAERIMLAEPEGNLTVSRQ